MFFAAIARLHALADQDRALHVRELLFDAVLVSRAQNCRERLIAGPFQLTHDLLDLGMRAGAVNDANRVGVFVADLLLPLLCYPPQAGA